MSAHELEQIADLPKGGPLEEYRKKASFNWKKMKLFFEELDLIKYKVKCIKFYLNLKHFFNHKLLLRIIYGKL